MKPEEIQEAAKEAGFQFLSQWNIPSCTVEAIQRFAAIIEKRTIERCAVVCDEYHSDSEYPGFKSCAEAIRKLGEQ